jgi:hypothetical protein
MPHRLGGQRRVVNCVHIFVVKPYRASSGGKQKRVAKPPPKLLVESLDHFKRIVKAMLKLLFEQQAIGQARPYAEIEALYTGQIALPASTAAYRTVTDLQNSGGDLQVVDKVGVPDGIRTRVIAVKGRCPRPG